MTSQQIAFNNFQREPQELVTSELEAAQRVLRSGWWILGKEVESFEQQWARRCCADGCVGVANGLDAIEIGLRAIGIGAGDEVITTSLTAFATTLAIQRCGAIPVFADIDASTACLSPAAVDRCLSPATKAVLVVHLYGRAADLGSLASICERNGIELVEDCAQAHGASFNGQPVGSVGVFGAWSFYPTKNLGAIGDGGAITSSNPVLLAASRKLRNYGQADRYHHDLAGMNSRLDELQAAFLLERLPYLQNWTERRRAIAERYWNEVHNPTLQTMAQPADPASHVHHLFVLRSAKRESVLNHLKQHGVSSLIHYPIPSHAQKAIGAHRLDPAGLTVTERHASTCFSLPIHPFLTDDEVSQVIDACNSAQ